MQNTPFETRLELTAKNLAEYIDKKTGDFPLVDFATAEEKFLTWEYANSSIRIRFGGRVKLPWRRIIAPSTTFIDITLPSADEAFRLIKMTEAIRQGTGHPYIILGKMPRL
jgi:hypothetical protein